MKVNEKNKKEFFKYQQNENENEKNKLINNILFKIYKINFSNKKFLVFV